MDISSLTNVPRACACWRLACELDRAPDILNARPKVKLTEENFCALFVPTAAGLSAIPGKLYHELRRHCGRLENFAFWETHLPPRTAADTECVRCRTLPLDRNHFHAVSSPLSVGGAMALCRDCELELGLNLPPYWPRCDECARPFPTTTAGEAALGRWVSPIDNGEPLCGNCWLAQRYHGDHTAMIEHTLATDTLQLAQGAVALDFRRMRFGTDILDQACTWLWSGAGILELLRTGSVTLTEAAAVIRRRAIQIGIESPARGAALKRREAIWREQQRAGI